jgi:F-type H+-transporting ATPase subunit b
MPLAANPLIEVAPGLMIWTLIAFGITFFVLKRYAFGPVQKIIDERRQRIRESLAEADKAREESRKLLEEHKQLRAGARAEAEEILSEARRVADSMRERVREETDEDRQRRLDETRRQIEAETRGALAREDQKRLIEDAVKDLDFSALERTGS